MHYLHEFNVHAKYLELNGPIQVLKHQMARKENTMEDRDDFCCMISSFHAGKAPKTRQLHTKANIQHLLATFNWHDDRGSGFGRYVS